MNELTTQQAHDIVNKEINVILKGCGTKKYEGHYKCRTDNLCPECISKLKGIISAQERFIDRFEE